MTTKTNKETTHIVIDNKCQSENSKIYLLGVDIGGYSRVLQFIFATIGLFLFYIIYGYLQEKIFLIPHFKTYGWYLTWCQFIVYSILGFSEMTLSKIHSKSVPIRIYVIIALLTVCTMGFSNTSVGYLNYPTQVIFKCCKLIPTMIGGVLIQHIKYTKLDIVSVLLMIIGLIWFTLADNMVQPHFSLYGVVLISLALCADGAIGNVQEKVMKQYSVTSSEIVFYSYSIGLIFISAGLIVSGQFLDAYEICSKNPIEIYGIFFLFSLSGYFGVQFVLFLVRHFGALPAVTVTTCRKAVTIILSFLFFQKTFTISYVYSGMLVLLGIYMNLYSKNKNNWQPKLNSFIVALTYTILRRTKSKEEIVV